jgi:hypothetical protein
MFARSTAVEQLRLLIGQPKILDQWPQWEPVSAALGARLGFVSGLSIDGVGLAGLSIRGTALRDVIGEDVVFQLEAVIGNRPRPIARLEYRPISGHRNPRNRHDFMSQIDVGISHHHPFEANARLGLSAFEADNLPLAMALEPQPSSLNEFVYIVASAFGIPDLTQIGWPEWQGRLQL